MRVKRVFDIVVASVSLVLLAVPLTLIALAVKFSSLGPIIYRQRRIGRGGRPFWLYKFRTMRCTGGGNEVTAEGDPRITPIGRVLRRFKLDELPQLWNILRGEMTVIGPRPEVERFVRHYTPEQRRLLERTPGLAGLSQLVYPHEAELLRGFADPEEVYLRQLMPRKLAVDLHYESIRTFWSDVRLMAEIGLLIVGMNGRRDQNFHMAASEQKQAGSSDLLNDIIRD